LARYINLVVCVLALVTRSFVVATCLDFSAAVSVSSDRHILGLVARFLSLAEVVYLDYVVQSFASQVCTLETDFEGHFWPHLGC
jgi:hypothetical protein